MEKGTVSIVLILAFFTCVTIGAISQGITEYNKARFASEASVAESDAKTRIALYQSIAGVNTESTKRQEAFVDLMKADENGK